MRNLGKLFYLIMPLGTAILLFIAIYQLDHHVGWETMGPTIGVLVVLLLLNILLFRSHVKKNPWLNPSDRFRSMAAVTKFGPLGQLVYYLMHIHPFDADTEKPTQQKEDKGLTEGDQFL